MNSEDFILLLLTEYGGSLESVTKLQKMAFLSIYEGGVSPFTDFEWYHYGPYSRELQEVVELLDEGGLISEEEERKTSYFGDIYTVKTLRLTPRGKRALEEKMSNIDSEERRAIRNILRQYGDRPLSKLLDYVYKAYSPSDL